MRETLDIVLPLEQSENENAIRKALAERLKLPDSRVINWHLLKHSLDARQRQIKVQLRLDVGIDEPLAPPQQPTPDYPQVDSDMPRAVIVGCGPGGMFAALRCLELGIKPIVLERGKDASARRFDLAPILRKGTVIEDSNYCFGEGGAGTFSDGKLYTRATKRGPVRDIYEALVAHGAPERILVDAHPHIGSNLLPNVVMAIRKSIIASGGEVHFQSRVTALIRSGKEVIGVKCADGKVVLADGVILATGHSARDIYRMLLSAGVTLEQKPFAVGVRIEHSQERIDSIQYHLAPGHKRHNLLPAASYRVATKIDDRGVHSFCMCPGGFIVPAATENDEVVVNGMSLSRRDSKFANSGLVVTVEPEDTAACNAQFGVLAGVMWQKKTGATGKGSRRWRANRTSTDCHRLY